MHAWVGRCFMRDEDALNLARALRTTCSRCRDAKSDGIAQVAALKSNYILTLRRSRRSRAQHHAI